MIPDWLPVLAQIRDFLESGGYVLWIIFMVSLLLWALILERYWYLRRSYPRQLQRQVEQWKQRSDTRSWYAQRIREAMVSRLNSRLTGSLALISTLVALCPMLGLLGTVTGMIQVFDVMAITGTGNARAMASGVSMATIPTMAGLVTALSGYYFSARLKHHAQRARLLMADQIRDYSGEPT